MQNLRSNGAATAAARRADLLGSHEKRIGPPERRDRLTREAEQGPRMVAGAVAAASAPELVDVGDIALRVVGHGFDRDFADFVARCAARLGLVGWIRIGSGEAMIRAVGSEDNLAALIRELRDHAPVDASVRGFELERVDALPPPPGDGFIALLETTAPAMEPAMAGEPCAAADQAVLV